MKSNSQDNVVYLIDSRGVITPDNIDSQQRHIKYAYELGQRSPRNRFIVITSSKNSNLTRHYKTSICGNKKEVSESIINKGINSVSIEDLKLKTLFKEEIFTKGEDKNDYWNGLGIFVLNKI